MVKQSGMKCPGILIFIVCAALWSTLGAAQTGIHSQVREFDVARQTSPIHSSTVAIIQGLDKITARVLTIDAPVGKQVRFGTLDIMVRRCHKRPPTETPETTAYIEIRERRLGEAVVDLFAGWMFASSPAASSMEHPIYDVWVVNCKNSSSSG